MTINKQYGKNTLLAWTIGFFIFIYIIFNVLFPSFKIDSSQGGNFSLREIDGKKFLELKIKGGYSFHKIKIKTKNRAGGKLFGKIYQDELGLYPLGSEINTQEQLNKFLKITDTELVNGELVQKGNFVYFISNGTYRAFANAETFDNLGFDWKKIKRNESGKLKNLSKGRIIDKTISYIPGEFVLLENRIYLLGEDKKFLIENEKLVDDIKSKFSIISINANKLKVVGEMKCKNTRERSSICLFKDDLKKTPPQATIFIKLEENLQNSWVAKIYTFDGLKSLVPRITLSNIKRNLLLRYDQRLGISK